MSEQDQKLPTATLELVLALEEVGLALLDELSQRLNRNHHQ